MNKWMWGERGEGTDRDRQTDREQIGKAGPGETDKHGRESDRQTDGGRQSGEMDRRMQRSTGELAG